MSEIRRISYSEILGSPNAQALLDGYAAECAIEEIGEPSPQGEMYAKLESANVLQCFGAYAEGLLVGFASVLISVLPHYGQLTATVESIYVEPKMRGLLGIPLMATIEAYATERGCQVILYSAPTGSRFEWLLASLQSYAQTNSVFCRRLG